MNTDWKTWNKVLLRNKESLPDYSGIYIVVDHKESVLYVGKSQNIKDRWVGHHRHKQLIRKDKKDKRLSIYFCHFPVEQLDREERYYINLLYPSLNNTKVTKYVPKVPIAESKIVRLLHTLNRKTLLSPDFRSLVIGYWLTEEFDDSYCHVAIAVGLNEISIDGVIINSVFTKNKRARLPRKNTNWRHYGTYCGFPESKCQPVAILTYLLDNLAIYFVWIGWAIFDWAKDNQEQLAKINLLGVETYCLKDALILKDIELEQHSQIKREKKRLSDSDFILSVLPLIKPVIQDKFDITSSEI